MTSTSTAVRHISNLARRVWVWYVAAAVVFVGVLALRSVLSGPKTPERRIAEQVYDKSCFIRVVPDARVASRWPRASKAEVITCDASKNDSYPIDLMDYAEFASPAALSAALKAAPPEGMYSCTIASTVVTLYDVADRFRAMCAQRGGTLRHKSAWQRAGVR